MGISISGLASGLDWETLVDELIEISSEPMYDLEDKKEENESKLDVLEVLSSYLETLEEAAAALQSDDLFADRVASESDDLGWSVTAADNATIGTYEIDVTQLATQTETTGSSDIAASVSDEDITSTSDNDIVLSEMRLATTITAGTFTVNGEQIEIETTDSLGDVFEKISTATDGEVTGYYDADTDTVSLVSSTGEEITLGSGSDSSNLLYALKLYNSDGATEITSTTTLGVIEQYESIADSGLAGTLEADENGDGSIEINGVTIEYNINDDSLSDLMDRVNDSDAGVTMAYDATSGSFTLTNNSEGSLGLWAEDTSGNLLSALGLGDDATTALGTNAIFTINGGGTIVSASNTLTSSEHGVTGLTINATCVGSQTITVEADTDAIEEGINDFISAYNSVQSYIESQTEITVESDGSVTSSLMSDNSEFDAIARKLRSLVFSSVSDMDGTIQRLESIGIDFDGSDYELSIQDSSALAEALASNLEEVEALFSSDDGVGTRLEDYISKITGTNGLIETQEESLESQNDTIDTQIDAWERRLEAERERLEASFIAMEEAQANLDTQLSTLESILETL